MDDEVANASEADNVPCRGSTPTATVGPEIETPRYRLLGDAPDLATRWGAARAFTTVMPNGMAASLSFADVDRFRRLRRLFAREPEP